DQLGGVLAVPHVLDGAPDLRGVTPDLAACLIELATLLAGRLRAGRAGTIPDIGVASHDLHHLLATGTDPDWRVRFLNRLWVGDGVFEVVVAAIDRGSVVAPEREDSLERLPQTAHAMVEPFDAVHLVLDLRPCG